MPRRDRSSPVTERVAAVLAHVRERAQGPSSPGRGALDGVAERPLLSPSRETRGPDGADGVVAGWVPAPPDGVGAGPGAGDEAEAEARRRPGRHRAGGGPRVVTVPATLRHARVHASAAAVMALLVVLLVAGLVLGMRVAWAQRAGAPESVTPSAGPAPGTVTRPVPAAFATGAAVTSGPGASGTGRPVVVHVVGQVAVPGVVRVAEGARVLDALAMAGGPLPGADLQRVNLARRVTDGEQLHVPGPGEPLLAPAGTRGGAGGGDERASPGGGAGPGPAGGLVDLNAADAVALDTLPGVGPVLAQRIIDWRAEHGRFTSVDELGEVSGIGQKLLAQLTPKVRV